MAVSHAAVLHKRGLPKQFSSIVRDRAGRRGEGRMFDAPGGKGRTLG